MKEKEKKEKEEEEKKQKEEGRNRREKPIFYPSRIRLCINPYGYTCSFRHFLKKKMEYSIQLIFGKASFYFFLDSFTYL